MRLPISLAKALSEAVESVPKIRPAKRSRRDEETPSAEAVAVLASELRLLSKEFQGRLWKLSVPLEEHYDVSARPQVSKPQTFAPGDRILLSALISAAEKANLGNLNAAVCYVLREEIKEGFVDEFDLRSKSCKSSQGMRKAIAKTLGVDGQECALELGKGCLVQAYEDLNFKFKHATVSGESEFVESRLMKYTWSLVVWPTQSGEDEISPLHSGHVLQCRDEEFENDKQREKELLARLKALEDETAVAPSDERIPCDKWPWGRFRFGHVIEKKLDAIMKSDAVCGWISGLDGVPTARKFASLIEERGPPGIICRAGGRGSRAFVYIRKPEEGAERATFDAKINELQKVEAELEDVRMRIAKRESRTGRNGIDNGEERSMKRQKLTSFEEATTDRVNIQTKQL